MGKRKRKEIRSASTVTDYSEFTINQNKTLGPEASLEATTSQYSDATGASNLADEEEPVEYAPSTAGLAEKYLLSGNFDVPIW